VKLLLDSNVVIALIKLEPRVVRQLNQYSPGDLAMSSMAMFELAYGALKSNRVARNLKVLGDVGIPVLEFDAADARTAGEIRWKLEKEGMPIGAYDTLIAGQALARGLTLVTRNTREFGRVEGLRLENWEA